jgi:hypothetical protein
MEKFNENIRKKLLEIEPEFHKRDWEEMHAFMTKVSEPKIFWTKDRLVKTGLIIAFLSSLMYNFIGFDSAKNSTLQTQNTENKIYPYKTKQITKTDTVYITKYKTKYVTVYIRHKNNEALASKKNDVFTNETSLKPDLIEVTASKPKNTELELYPNKNTNLSNVNESPIQFTIKTINSIEYSPTEWHNNLKIKALDFPSINLKKKKENLLILKIPRPKLEAPNLNAGLMLDVTAAKTAYAAIAETAITPKIGLLTGIKYAEFAGQDYYTEKQFEAITGQNFRNLVETDLPVSKEIINIEARYNLLQIPFQINYRYAFAAKYKFTLGLSTDFNILSKQKIRYNYNNDNLVFEEGLFKNKFKSPFFNNINLLLGLEKHYDKYVFQLRPYAGMYFGKTNYVTEKMQAGVNLSILRKIKK